MSQFTVTGRYQSRDRWQPFEKAMDAPNEDVAVEHVYSEFGSHHHLRRTQVEIERVEEAGA